MTSQKTIKRQVIADAMECAGIHAISTINDTYDGRHVTGETCLSFVIEGKRVQRKLSRFFVELGIAAGVTSEGYEADQECSMAQELADVVSTDDLGLDVIVYFPSWKLAG
jgi:hypothetical protein